MSSGAAPTSCPQRAVGGRRDRRRRGRSVVEDGGFKAENFCGGAHDARGATRRSLQLRQAVDLAGFGSGVSTHCALIGLGVLRDGQGLGLHRCLSHANSRARGHCRECPASGQPGQPRLEGAPPRPAPLRAPARGFPGADLPVARPPRRPCEAPGRDATTISTQPERQHPRPVSAPVGSHLPRPGDEVSELDAIQAGERTCLRGPPGVTGHS